VRIRGDGVRVFVHGALVARIGEVMRQVGTKFFAVMAKFTAEGWDSHNSQLPSRRWCTAINK